MEQVFAEQLKLQQANAGDTADDAVSSEISEDTTPLEERPPKDIISADDTSEPVAHESPIKENSGSMEDTTSNVSKVEVSDDLGHFYRGTLRSGQSIEFASSIVVIGDVNPGAKVVAKGNIIVIGSLKGSAYAGVNGSPNAFIIALDMDPMQLRIGELYARSPDSKGFLKKKKQPSKEMQIAFVENNNIYIEPINRAVLNSII
jgi:septum site-determining protein MinC